MSFSAVAEDKTTCGHKHTTSQGADKCGNALFPSHTVTEKKAYKSKSRSVRLADALGGVSSNVDDLISDVESYIEFLSDIHSRPEAHPRTPGP